MKLNKEQLSEMVQKITKTLIKEGNNPFVKFDQDKEDDQPIEESTYEFDSSDPNLQTKTTKLQSDPTLFNKDTDKIEIGNTNESILVTKNQIVKLMVEAKAVRDKNGDYVRAIKKADREMEMNDKGPGFKSKDKAHKNDKKYNRKSFTKNELIEMLTQK